MLALILQRQLFPYFPALTDALSSLFTSSGGSVRDEILKKKKIIAGMTENRSPSG